MGSRFAELVIDCAQPEELARFWAAVLGGQMVRDKYGCVQVGTGEGPRLTFIEVPEAKAGKNRLHIDLSPVGCAQADEVERLLSLGGMRMDVGQGDVSWVVLADPEGNEFCVLAA